MDAIRWMLGLTWSTRNALSHPAWQWRIRNAIIRIKARIGYMPADMRRLHAWIEYHGLRDGLAGWWANRPR